MHRTAKTRRLFQFSLRATLLSVTVFSVWLGWLTDGARRQKEACARLRSMGGEPCDYVFVAGALPAWNVVARGPEWLTQFPDIDVVADVTQVRFKSPAHIGCDVVGEMRKLPYLESILLEEAELESSFIPSLKELPQLRSLSFERMLVADSTIEQLSNLRSLEELRLVGCTIADKSLSALAKLCNLKILDVTDTKISWSVIWRLEQLLPGCRIARSIYDHKHELVFAHLDGAAIGAASGLPAIDHTDWPTDIMERLALQVTHVRPDGLLELKGCVTYRIRQLGRIDRAWQSSFQGVVHISHIRINERGGQSVNLKDFTDLQGTICEISADLF